MVAGMSSTQHDSPGRGVRLLRLVGPGMVVAATGVGAGDLVAAAKAGAGYGVQIVWAVAFGALLKLVLAEGIARWQLVTGQSLLAGWFHRFGRWLKGYFFAYLALWSVVVAVALMSACGLAAHALVPSVSVNSWAVLHALVALVLVWCEGYEVIERLMRWAIALMFVTIIGSALLTTPLTRSLVAGLVVPRVPQGSTVLLAGVIGGVGGTLTLLSYGYWMEEKGWRGEAWLPAARVDLVVGYVLTGLFGIGITVLAGTVLFNQGARIEGSAGVLEMAGMLGPSLGKAGELVFVIGFWAAVATSIVGVWQGVPYLFANAVRLLGNPDDRQPVSTRSWLYRGYVLYLTFPPMLLLLLDRPVWMIIAYAVVGSLFMPLLAATLLLLNTNRKLLGRHVNSLAVNLALGLGLLLFVYLAGVELLRQFAALG